MSEKIPGDRKSPEYIGYLTRQNEYLWGHLEYLDSNVLKIMTAYFAALGLLMANLDRFDSVKLALSMLIIAVTVVFSLSLYRISFLLTSFKKRIRKINEEIHSYYEVGFVEIVPHDYISSKFRTSVVSIFSVILCSASLLAYIFTAQ